MLSEASQKTPGLYTDDWLSSGEAEVVEEALGLIDSSMTPSILLGSNGDSLEGTESREKASAGPSKGQMYGGASSSSQKSKRDSLVDAAQVGYPKRLKDSCLVSLSYQTAVARLCFCRGEGWISVCHMLWSRNQQKHRLEYRRRLLILELVASACLHEYPLFFVEVIW